MIILASASPRRRELIERITHDFTTIPSNFDEKAVEFHGDIEEYVLKLAQGKAEEVSVKYPEDIVIGMDTVVFKNGVVLNKPKDFNEAKEMMKFLENDVHEVYTGFSIIDRRFAIVRKGVEKTEVYFDKIDEEELEVYLLKEDWKDKAGAYGIQGDAALFVKKINGDFFNVVGMPVNRIKRELKNLGVL